MSREAMDEPGEWIFDAEQRRLSICFSEPPNDVTVARVTELVRVEGEQDEWDYRDEPVRGISFRGITFAHGKRYAWRDDKTGWGLQHDWEMYDEPTAMVRLRFAR